MKIFPKRPCVAIASFALATVVVMFATSAMNASATTSDDHTDFHVIQRASDTQKFLTYGWSGWSNKTVNWRYNDANRPIAASASADAMVASVRAAMNKWSAVCAVNFVYGGATSNGASLATSGTLDAINTVTWGTLDAGVAALTYVGTSNASDSSPTLNETDMVISVDQGAVGLDALLLHEVGHMLGLTHSNVENAVMSGPNTAPNPSTSYTQLTALTEDDITGCRSLYGDAAPIPSNTTVSVSATTLTFADTPVSGVSDTQIVGVINQGVSLLTVSDVKLTGDDYILISSTCSASTPISANGRCGATVRFAPKALGARSGALVFTHNATAGTATVALAGIGIAASSSAPQKREMVEYRFAPLDYYFMTSRDADKVTLDAATGWARTGEKFFVYTTQGAGTLGVNRYYFDMVALNGVRGTHFYTLLASDISTLTSLNPTNANTPGLPQSEGVDSYALLPLVTGIGGSCGAGLLPVYRLFRGGALFPDDPNHRFTTTLATYNDFVGLGWTGEGVSFCVPAS